MKHKKVLLMDNAVVLMMYYIMYLEFVQTL